jgi:peptide subunit release factor 1 (eRF1)
MTANPRQVEEHVDALEEELERAAEADLVARLVAAVGSAERGVAGLGPVLAALSEERVAQLLVSVRLSAIGARCSACGRLAETGPTCPTCGERLMEHPDVIEAAVARAFRSGARVEIVQDEGSLRASGGIGALLRF